MIVNPLRKAPETVSPLRSQAEVEQATFVADAWRERRDAALVESGRKEDYAWRWRVSPGGRIW